MEEGLFAIAYNNSGESGGGNSRPNQHIIAVDKVHLDPVST